MKDWSKEFNKLPKEVRQIAVAISNRENIQYLNFEKQRLKKRYTQSLKEINEHIKSLKSWAKSQFNE